MSYFGMQLSFCNNINVQKVDDNFPEEFSPTLLSLVHQEHSKVKLHLQWVLNYKLPFYFPNMNYIAFNWVNWKEKITMTKKKTDAHTQ